jgi:hypothetical protein
MCKRFEALLATLLSMKAGLIEKLCIQSQTRHGQILSGKVNPFH